MSLTVKPDVWRLAVLFPTASLDPILNASVVMAHWRTRILLKLCDNKQIVISFHPSISSFN